MIPLVLFLLACALAYIGTVQAAFSAMMRLSLRLVAERNGRAEMLGRYLDDPLLFFVPARLFIGASAICSVVLLVRLIGADTPQQVLAVVVFATGMLIACEHVIPLLIVRRDPERVLEVLLPSFAATARLVQPLTAAMVRLGVMRRERAVTSSPDADEQQGEAAQAYIEAGEQEGLIEGDERRLIQ